MSALPEVDFTLDEDDYDASCRNFLEILKPDWNGDEVTLTVPTVGFLNLTIICRNQRTKQAVVIKTIREIYSGPTEENRTLYKFLHDVKLGPDIYALFNNGVVMQCVEGESFNWESPRMYDDDVWQPLAEELARWHRRSILERAVEMGVRKRKPTHLDIERHWDAIMNMPLFRDHKDKYPTKKQLRDEWQNLNDDMVCKGELYPAFLHFDVNPANIFITKEEPGIKMIDFDSSGRYYAQYELSWFFRTFKEHSSPTDFVPGRDYEVNFIRHYLEHRYKLDGDGQVSEDDVMNFYKQVQKAKLFVTLRSIIFPTFIQAYGGIMHYYIPHVQKMWREFPDAKARIFEEFSTE